MMSKNHLISEFYNIRGNDIAKMDKLIAEIEANISKKEPDAQLQLLIHSLEAHKEELSGSNFATICKTVTPILDILQHIVWGLLEIDVLSFSINHIESYQLTIELMKKAIALLDSKYNRDEHTAARRFLFYFNISLRLLRAKFYDALTPEEFENLEELFEHCINQAISICEEKSSFNGFITYRTVLLTRQAIFHGNADKVLECIHALRNGDDKAWLKTTSDEVVEYCKFMGRNVTTTMKNFMVGYLMKKRRVEIGMTTAELADAVGASQTNINEIERGANGVSGKRLIAVAQVLGVEASYFLGNTQPQNSVQDITTHKLLQLMQQMNKQQKEFVYNMAKQFMQVTNGKDC